MAKFYQILGNVAILAIMLALSGMALISRAAPEPTARKIVVFKPGVEELEKEALVNKVGGTKIKHLRLINGKAVLLSKSAEKTLSRHPNVLRIDDDVKVEALVKADNEKIKINGTPKPQPIEVLPWGIDRIDAELVWPSGNAANPIKVAIVDTGIDISHPDLKDNIKGGMSAVGYTTSYNDDNGHGTHVAGIVGAID
ncbi:MAG: S8 family serine peptidase, partial [Patescibacteria group bacterium]